ncbi:MAG: beta-lactamase family protein [Steroidobacteraceae bacterium]|nr:beta-lactamase family protein [Steroidobacteraceae bacterium]
MKPFPRVTHANWGYPPHNRWSFQHIQELFPTCRLARGQSTSLNLPTQSRDILPLRFQSAVGSNASISDFLATAFCDAFLVVQGGRVIAEHYSNEMNGSSAHLLNSVTKSFVGMLAGIAVEHGQLDPSSLVTRYLPELDNAAWRGTTVRHLLDMTAAARYAEDYANPSTDFWMEAAVVGWRAELVTPETPQSLLDYARSLAGQDMENGSRFQYRSVATNVLGLVIERAMAAPLATLLETGIWSMLATAHDAAIVVDGTGFPYVAAGMNATARDLANFGVMMINDGTLGGRQVIPAAWIADTVRGDSNSVECFARGNYGSFMPGWHYRNQVWVASRDPALMLAIGIHGQFVYMDKARDLVIVMLSSQPQSIDLLLYQDALTAMSVIASWLSESPAPAKRQGASG